MPLEGHRGDVLRLSFDPSSDFLASADGAEVILWSVKDRAEVSRITLPKGYVTTSLVVSPRGRYIATSSSDGDTRLWDTTSNDRTGTVLPANGTTSLTFSPDGRWLSIGSQNEIKLWNLTAEEIDSRRIPVVITTIGASPIRFSPDGTLLAALHWTGSSDVVSVWNIRDVQPVGTVSAGLSGIYGFAFTPDSARLAVASQGVFVEPFNASWALQHICRITGRNLTREEWDQHAQGFDYIATCP